MKTVGQPRHPLDFAHQKRMAKKLDALLNGRMVDATGNPVGEIHYADGNAIYQFSGSSNLKMFQLVSHGGDYLNCNPFDGVTAIASVVKVALDESMRCTLPTASPAGGAWTARTERGVAYTFTYAQVVGMTTDGVNVIEYTRTKTVGADGTFKQGYITPCLNVGDIIFATPAPTFAGPATLIGVKWLALSAGRAWADDLVLADLS